VLVKPLALAVALRPHHISSEEFARHEAFAEVTMILVELLFALMLAGAVLLVFPHFAGLLLLILVLVVGFAILDRRYPRGPVRHWP